MAKVKKVEKKQVKLTRWTYAVTGSRVAGVFHRVLSNGKRSVHLGVPAPGVEWNEKEWKLWYRIQNTPVGVCMTLDIAEVGMLRRMGDEV